MVDLTPPPEAPVPDDLSNQVLSKNAEEKVETTGLPGLPERAPANELVRSAGETACPTTRQLKAGAASRWGRRFRLPSVTPANSSRASPCAAPPSPTERSPAARAQIRAPAPRTRSLPWRPRRPRGRPLCRSRAQAAARAALRIDLPVMDASALTRSPSPIPSQLPDVSPWRSTAL